MYSSHFTGIYFSSCLLFQIIQFFLLVTGHTRAFKERWALWLTYVYWITLTFSGFMSGVCYSLTPKPDTIAIQFLICFTGLTGVGFIFFLHTEHSREAPNHIRLEAEGIHPEGEENINKQDTTARILSDPTIDSETSPGELQLTCQKHSGRASRLCLSFSRIFNRFLKALHWAMSIMFIAGAITLALTYRFANPYVRQVFSKHVLTLLRGELIQVKLPTGQTRSLNYNCTAVPSNGTFLPTFWLEGSEAHGIVDFLGLQHFLAVNHGRNSCSFDPPNFGWSENLVSSLQDSYSYFNPLLEALDKQKEERIMVGWGDGAHSGLVHANENPSTTKAFVILDASPDGIEWFDLQRKNHWNEKQTLEYRDIDMAGRILLTNIILSIAIPW